MGNNVQLTESCLRSPKSRVFCVDDNAISRQRSIRKLNYGGTALSVSRQLDAFLPRQSMQTSVCFSSFTGHPCGFHRYISLIAELSSCVPSRAQVLAMSTTREGETRGIVESYHTLSDRLNRLLDAAQRPSGDDTNLRILIHCREILKCWEDDELSSVGIRNLSTKPEKVERFRGRIAEANELLPHCGQMLGISFSDNIPAKYAPPILVTL